ncbi:MAG: hypothetical protein WED05_10515 [Candidatus Atabeyarchaeum deiterrae]
MSQDVTFARMVKISDEPILLPNEFQKVLGENTNALMILAVSTKTVRLIPTTSSEAVKVSIEIKKLTPEYLKQMSETFVKRNLKVVYSTGFCYKGDKCLYEAYFDPSQISIKDKEMQDLIESLEGTTKVEVKRIDLETTG